MQRLALREENTHLHHSIESILEEIENQKQNNAKQEADI